MMMKHLLLATTAIVAVSVASVPAMADGGEPPPGYRERDQPPPPPPPPPPPQAQVPPPVEMRRGYTDCLGGPTCEGGKGSGWYISVLGGGNWIADDNINYRFAAVTSAPQGAVYAYQDFEADAGFVVGAAVGRDLCCWVPGLRGELELSYRRNYISGYHEDGTDNLASTNQIPDVTGPLDGHISSWALMANVWYDFDLGGVNPYVGGGIGWGHSRFKANYFNTTFSAPHGAVDETDNGFVYQLGAGLNVPITHGARLGLGYRYTDFGEFQFNMPPLALGAVPWVHPAVSSVTFDNKHHSAMINLTVDID
jgi:opacity protein-like surface antigen